MAKTSTDVIAWIERYCTITAADGRVAAVRLAPYQKKIIVGIYDSPSRLAIISLGRKNAKTWLAAALMLVHLVGPRSRQNGNLYSSALTRDQAAILFRQARQMVLANADLAAAIVIMETFKELHAPGRGTTYRSLSADAASNLGADPCFLVHDELGSVRGPRSDLYDALETACSAQAEPLSIVISTQAASDQDLLSMLIDDAERRPDARTKLVFWSAPEELDPFSDAALKAANPAFDHFANKRELRDQAAKAKRLPSFEASYRNFHLNQRVESSNPFLSASVWKACAGRPDLELFQKTPIYIAIDLAKTNDLTAVVWIAQDDEQCWHVQCEFYAPEQGVHERARRDGADYPLWARQGLLTLTPGASTDYGIVARRVLELVDEHDVVTIAYDRWRIGEFKAELGRLGRELPQLREYGQAFKDMSPAIEALEAALLNGKLRHGANPILDMCARNAVTTSDAVGNRMLDKKRAVGRIDGIVALAMALGAAKREPAPPEKDYNIYVIG